MFDKTCRKMYKTLVQLVRPCRLSAWSRVRVLLLANYFFLMACGCTHIENSLTPLMRHHPPSWEEWMPHGVSLWYASCSTIMMGFMALMIFHTHCMRYPASSHEALKGENAWYASWGSTSIMRAWWWPSLGCCSPSWKKGSLTGPSWGNPL